MTDTAGSIRDIVFNRDAQMSLFEIRMKSIYTQATIHIHSISVTISIFL